MEQRHRDLLLAKRLEITSDLRFRHIRRHLLENGILNAADLDDIEIEQSRDDQAKALLDILPNKGPEAFAVFRDALKHRYPHLARILRDDGQEELSKDIESRVFVIHAGEDKESFVRPLVTNIQQQGVAEKDIFFDDISIKPGEVVRERIISTLSSQSLELAVIVVSTSLLKKHYWPKLEFETCLRNNKRIFPIWVDANNDSFKAFSELVGKYSPTLKQLSARRVQRDDVINELPNIAAEIVRRLSTLQRSPPVPEAIQTLLYVAPSPTRSDSFSSNEDQGECTAGVSDEQQVQDELKNEKAKQKLENLNTLKEINMDSLIKASKEGLMSKEKIEEMTESLIRDIHQSGLQILKVKIGCAIVHLVPNSLAALDRFWRDYRSGQLSRDFSHYLITDEMRAVVGKDLFIRVIMLEEQYRQWKHYFDAIDVTETVEEFQTLSIAPASPLSRIRKNEVEHDIETRSYLQLHFAAETALQNGDLDAAERHFASALKQVHARESPRLREEEECLRKLGDVYVRRGEQTKDGQDFAKATALYNAALARNGDRKLLIDSIKEAERLFLYHTVGINCKPAPYETDMEHKNRLEKQRAEVKVRLETIHKDHNPYQYEEDDPLVKEVEKKRAEAVRDLLKDISEQRKDLIKDLVKECIETIGRLPCQYAMVGLGSQATELVTPYSDLEFAILIENDKDTPESKEYFLNLTCYLYLKIINLGETILPAMAIESLNDFRSENPADSWFYDSVTPRGFAFDGAMPWASKTPFGREKTRTKPAVSLIQTPAGMAEFQRHDIALAHGYHLSSILRYVSYLTGDQTLVDDYMARVIQELDTLDKNGEAPVADGFARFSLLHTLQERRDQELTDKLLDVKREIYRFPTVAVMNLALLEGVYATSVWDTIKEMEEAGVVTKENAHHLMVLVSISGELRLRTYLELGGQKENLSGLLGMQTQQGDSGSTQQEEGGEALLKSVFHVPDQKMLLRYHYTAIPLKTYFLGLKMGWSAEFMATLPERRSFYDASSWVKAAICTKLLQFKEVLSHTEEALKALEEGKDAGPWLYGSMGSLDLKASLLGQLAESYSRLGDHRKAISCWEERLEIQQQLHRHGSSHEEMGYTYTHIATACIELLNAGHSVDLEKLATIAKQTHLLFNKDIDAGHLNPDHELLTTLPKQYSLLNKIERMIGNPTIQTTSDLVSAMKSYGEETRMLSKAHILNRGNSLHPYIAKLLQVLVRVCNMVQGDYAKAITYTMESLKIMKITYGQDTAHPDIVAALTDAGDSLCGLEDHVGAVRCYEEALEMNTVVYMNGSHPGTANILNKLGSVFRKAGEYTKSLQYYERALEMNKAIHGQDAAHPSIAESLSDLAAVYGDLKDHTKAIQLYEDALNMLKVIHGGSGTHGDDEVSHPDIVNVLRKLGYLWSNVGDNEKALAFSEQELKMNQQLYGHSTPHYDTAIALGNMGLDLEKSGDKVKAISFYEEALKMLEEVLEESNPDIAWLLSNLGSAHHKAGEYKKSLRYYERALEINKAIHGQDAADPSIAESLWNVANACKDLGNYTKAIQLYEEALNMLKVIHCGNEEHGGDELRHPDIACVLNNLGDLWNIVGDKEKARAFFESALKMDQELYDPTTPNHSTAISLGNMGEVSEKSGDYPKAISFYEEALTMLEKVLGKSRKHPDMAWLLGGLASAYHKTGEDMKSLQYCEKALGMMKEIPGEDALDPIIAVTIRNIATVYEDLGDHTKAIQLYQDALHRVQTVQAANKTHPDILKLLNNLETVYNKIGDQEKASSYRDQARVLKKAAEEEKTHRGDTDSTEESPRKDTGSPEETSHTD